jgi:regulatory protein
MDRRRAPRKLDSEALWDYALRILAQRPNSSSELEQKLSKRADSPASVRVVLQKLREYGLADDLKFSEAFASARLQNEGFGRMRVLRDLRAKRVAPSIAHKAIEKTFAGVDEADLITQYLQRKYRGRNLQEVLADQKQLASAYRRLRNAGFSGSASLAVLKRYSKAAEQIDDMAEEDA